MLPGIGIFGTSCNVSTVVSLLKHCGFKVEAIWDFNLLNARVAAKNLDIPYYTNKVDDVLLRKDVDLIFIMCSPNLQSQIAVKALGIGKHVVCEKPAGLSQWEAIKMVRASQYYPSLISIINHNLRFLPAFCLMKKAISEGYLGGCNKFTVCDIRINTGNLRSNSYNWMCDKTMGGGTVTLVASQFIDLITYLTGQKAVKLHSVIKTFQEKLENTSSDIRHVTSPDFCVVQMETNENALVTITVNSYLPVQYNQEIMICGKNGNLIVRNGDLYGIKNGTEEIIYKENEISRTESIIDFPKQHTEGLSKLIMSLKEAFLLVEDKSGWVKEPVASAATFEDGLYIHAVVEALYESSLHKKWMKVKVMDEEPDQNPLLSAALKQAGIFNYSPENTVVHKR